MTLQFNNNNTLNFIALPSKMRNSSKMSETRVSEYEIRNSEFARFSARESLKMTFCLKMRDSRIMKLRNLAHGAPVLEASGPFFN